MRLFVLSALAITAFVATMVIDRTDANAVVYCARGVYPCRLCGTTEGCSGRASLRPSVRASLCASL
jgi:hypothetical protein